MATILFNDVVFGPIKSRRLGISLGINLLPDYSKLCNFNCIYCECGWNRKGEKKEFNSREDVKVTLEAKLKEMAVNNELPDTITFSGNGEPTMHPDFAEIIDDTIALRDKYAPSANVSVLSNATMSGREKVFNALLKVDRAILKLDSGFDETVQLIDKPQGSYSVATVVKRMKKFNGKMTLQTMFLKGELDGKRVDNTEKIEVDRWLEVAREINPREIMIYTIDRETPAPNLQKVSIEELEKIANRARELGYTVQVSG
ncbi:MAG: radical SAM protein [Prevotellaceae bacterium]|jgi:wyosine [tRNA(Phe)-imidazoG37] synthetase (radical SAM superfamily)|nr:radical SAM protein [Prevotellaceae bacterium]